LSELNRERRRTPSGYVTGKSSNAQVQAFYRDVNERIARVSRGFDADGRLELLCECGSATCTERVLIESADYEGLRSRATHFAVLAGHEDSAVEDVVERRDGYLIVANYGAAATLARRTDPRARSR
jgi:hypothetical protein